MSMALIRKLRAQRDQLKVDTISPILARMEAGEDLDEPTKAALATADAEVQRLDAEVAALSEMESRALEAAARDAELDGNAARIAELATPGLHITERQAAPQFAALAAEKIIAAGGAGNVTIAASALSVIDNRDPNGVAIGGVTRVRPAPEPVTVTPLLDATAKQPVSSDDYEWEEWGLIPVAGDVNPAEGSVKPEASDAYEIKQGVLGLVAHHIGVSRRALEDRPQLEAKIRNRLARGVDLRAEAKATMALINGAYDEVTHTDGLLQAIRIGMATVQAKGFDPTTLVINPLDQAYIDIDLLKLSNAGAVRNAPTWSVREIVASAAVPAGTAYVGNIFDALLTTYRSDVQIYMTDSHSDEFVRNRIRILAEQRVSVNLQQPNAIVQVNAPVPTP